MPLRFSRRDDEDPDDDKRQKYGCVKWVQLYVCERIHVGRGGCLFTPSRSYQRLQESGSTETQLACCGLAKKS